MGSPGQADSVSSLCHVSLVSQRKCSLLRCARLSVLRGSKCSVSRLYWSGQGFEPVFIQIFRALLGDDIIGMSSKETGLRILGLRVFAEDFLQAMAVLCIFTPCSGGTRWRSCSIHRYKLEGRGYDSCWGHWNLSLT